MTQRPEGNQQQKSETAPGAVTQLQPQQQQQQLRTPEQEKTRQEQARQQGA